MPNGTTNETQTREPISQELYEPGSVVPVAVVPVEVTPSVVDGVANATSDDEDEEESISCLNCGDTLTDDTAYHFESQPYCEDCYEETTFSCNDCGDRTETDEGYRLHDYSICGGCYERNYFSCENCSEIEHTDDAHEDDDGNLICRDCYGDTGDGGEYVCSLCSTVFTRDASGGSSVSNSSYDTVCTTCKESLRQKCLVCSKELTINGNFSYTSKVVREGTLSGKYCSDCYYKNKDFAYSVSEGREKNYTCALCKNARSVYSHGYAYLDNYELIDLDCYRKMRSKDKAFSAGNGRELPYGYRTRTPVFFADRSLQFFTDKSDKYAHIGIEIECESGLTMKREDYGDRVLAVKRDGSISSWGQEVLTQPSSGKEFIKTVNEVVAPLKAHKWTGSPATGMHCHVEYKNASQKEIKNLFLLTYLIEPFIESKLPKSRVNNRYATSLRKLFNLDEVVGISSSKTDQLYYSMSRPAASRKVLLARDKDFKVRTSHSLNQAKRQHTVEERYCGLNLHSIYYRGTAEFRYPHTVVSEKHAIGFGLFFAGLVEYARSESFSMIPLLKKNPWEIVEQIDTPSMRLLKKECPEFLNKSRKKY